MAGKPKQPRVVYPDPLPPPPERSSSETQALAERQRSRFARGGRATTMLTGGQGTSQEQTSYAVRVLGGTATL